MQNNNLTAFERELADVLLDSINAFTPRLFCIPKILKNESNSQH